MLSEDWDILFVIVMFLYFFRVDDGNEVEVRFFIKYFFSRFKVSI